MDNLVELAALQDYMYCPMLYYWKHDRQGKRIAKDVNMPLNTSAELPGLTIRSAIRAWASREYGGHSFLDLVQDVWRVWFAHYDIRSDVQVMLARYAEERNAILDQFLTGKIRRSDGSRYIEPRLTNRYRDMVEMAGLSPLPKRLEANLQPAFKSFMARLPKLGDYHIAEAYSDSLLMAARYLPPEASSIIALREPVLIRRNGIEIKASIDLLLEGEDGVIAEVHDHAPVFYFDRRQARFDLRMIAIASTTAKWEEKPIHLVRYRHFQSAQELSRQKVRLSRLSFAVNAGLRGVRGNIYVPAFLGGELSRCLQCRAQDTCLGDGEDVFEHFMPGQSARGEAVLQMAMDLGLPANAENLQVIRQMDKQAITPQEILAFLENENGNIV